MADSFLRGMGVPGAVTAGLKNATMEYFHQRGKGYNADYSEVAEDLLNISPSIGSKFSKLDRAGDELKWGKGAPFKFELDNPSLEASLLTIEATTNAPVHAWHQNASNIQHGLSTQYKAWQRAMMLGGWTPHNVGARSLSDTKKLQEKYPGVSKERIEIKERSKRWKPLKKGEQVYLLKKLGITDREMKKLQKEENRIELIELFYKKNSKFIDEFMKNPIEEKKKKKRKVTW